jgi:hypothetical protein
MLAAWLADCCPSSAPPKDDPIMPPNGPPPRKVPAMPPIAESKPIGQSFIQDAAGRKYSQRSHFTTLGYFSARDSQSD